MAWSLLFRGGTVMDGTGAPGVRADVALEGDRIAAVGPNLTGQAARTIDVTGKVVTPGFIDAHSHSDLFYMDRPSAESKVRQGVTTEVVGMCSFSQAPLRWGQSYDTYIGDHERRRLGDPFWSRRVRLVVEGLRPVFLWDRLYLGGGNARLITAAQVARLGDDVVIVPNTAGIVGGVRAWALRRP